MEEFPHLVEMHKKYGKDGLAAISVALDNPGANKDVEAKVLNFLKEKKATFVNLILAETEELWREKLAIEGPPCVYVFNREGKIAKKFAEGFNYKDVEKEVQELLKKH